MYLLGPCDTLLANHALRDQLNFVDEQLAQRQLIERVRFINRDMVNQLFYVRNWIVGNQALPYQLRVSALHQLYDSLAGMPDFIVKAEEAFQTHGSYPDPHVGNICAGYLATPLETMP